MLCIIAVLMHVMQVSFQFEISFRNLYLINGLFNVIILVLLLKKIKLASLQVYQI